MPNQLFQERFLDIIEKNHNENMELINQYQKSYEDNLEGLKQSIRDLTNVKAHYKKLTNKFQTKKLFDNAEIECRQRTAKLQEEYFEDVIESYDSVDKRTKMLLFDNGVTQKQIYRFSERTSDTIIQQIRNKSRVSLEMANTDEIVNEICVGSQKKIKSHFFKIRFITIFLPILLLLTSFIVSMMSTTNQTQANNEQVTINRVIDFIKNAKEVSELLGGSSELSGIVTIFSWLKALKLSSILLVLVCWFLLYKFIVSRTQKGLIRKLEVFLSECINKYEIQINNNKLKFSDDLKIRLIEADKLYTSKYIELFSEISKEENV